MMSEKKYQIDLKCTNCKKLNWNIKITKGMTIEEFGQKENAKCRICNCYIIKVKEKNK